MFSTSPGSRLPIAVAVDGSPESVAALRWAAGHAQEHGCPLRVVTAYFPFTVSLNTAAAYREQFEAARGVARARAEAAMEEVLPGADVDHLVVLGPIEGVLRDQSREASMIVVGTRDSGTWSSKLRGSLTNRITGRVACPVVSIPLTGQADAAVPAA